MRKSTVQFTRTILSTSIIFKINEFYLFKNQVFVFNILKNNHKLTEKRKYNIHHDFSTQTTWEWIADLTSKHQYFLRNKGIFYCKNQEIENDILLLYGPQFPFHFANCPNMSFTITGSSSELHIILCIIQNYTLLSCLFSFFRSGIVPQIFPDFHDW